MGLSSNTCFSECSVRYHLTTVRSRTSWLLSTPEVKKKLKELVFKTKNLMDLLSTKHSKSEHCFASTSYVNILSVAYITHSLFISTERYTINTERQIVGRKQHQLLHSLCATYVRRRNGADDYSHQSIKRPVTGLLANKHVFKDYVQKDRLCGLVVRVPGYRFRGPGSIPGTTRSSEK
jgi:hypothetical protein